MNNIKVILMTTHIMYAGEIKINTKEVFLRYTLPDIKVKTNKRRFQLL